MSVRVYVPLTSTSLAALVAERRLDGPLRAHAVTPALRAEWPDADDESWEYAALMAAASASTGLRGPADHPRRMVVAADVPACEPVDGDDPTAVVVPADLPWAAVAAAHVDTTDDVGENDGEDAGEDDDLAWYATQEIPDLL